MAVITKPFISRIINTSAQCDTPLHFFVGIKRSSPLWNFFYICSPLACTCWFCYAPPPSPLWFMIDYFFRGLTCTHRDLLLTGPLSGCLSGEIGGVKHCHWKFHGVFTLAVYWFSWTVLFALGISLIKYKVSFLINKNMRWRIRFKCKFIQRTLKIKPIWGK